ncbi:HPr(Ser) kinase/phosphatase [Irregularibacter muris]|uniref:HPr kinase/phosphorylase n=1 Tax=Irregularibacter muris TaxID=1796619 RepID=A0AAE3HID6_9FIRM|nr:HPr(Ser) kinase/phosphatase [Irregularibacter muris]MCR1899138.1 HPr(Ser) kinase/phosphatase [Irregularibacter muris]
MSALRVQEMSAEMNLEIIYQGSNLALDISSSDINRPGLQLYGYFEYFDQDRVQILGKVEWSYLSSLSPEERRVKLENFFSRYFPCLIIAWDLEVFPEIIEYAKKYDRTVLRTPLHTTKVMYNVINYLDEKLAPQVRLHGVLVEVYGIGIFITGSSGVGKSETALELVKRGHRLIADDLVQIKQIAGNQLIGEAPEVLKYFIEIRGVGIIDVKTLYGVGAIKDSMEIDMVIHLEDWQEGKYYDRLGLENEMMDIMDVAVPKVTIPVMPGRNLSIIIETAARNHREKIMGYNAAQAFVDKVYQITTNQAAQEEEEMEK